MNENIRTRRETPELDERKYWLGIAIGGGFVALMLHTSGYEAARFLIPVIELGGGLAAYAGAMSGSRSVFSFGAALGAMLGPVFWWMAIIMVQMTQLFAEVASLL